MIMEIVIKRKRKIKSFHIKQVTITLIIPHPCKSCSLPMPPPLPLLTKGDTIFFSSASGDRDQAINGRFA